MGKLPNNLVFINCPFDLEYRAVFEAIVFTLYVCDHPPRCSLEVVDSGYSRLTKIVDLIDLCDFSLHDISRTELNRNQLPRFNMPFELGLALGRKYSKRIGSASKLLVLDREPHRYLEFLSDLRGCDPASHDNQPHTAIAQVRDWLASFHEMPFKGPNHLKTWFDQFLADLPGICREWGMDRANMSFKDLVFTIRFWVEANLPTA